MEQRVCDCGELLVVMLWIVDNMEEEVVITGRSTYSSELVDTSLDG